MRAERPRQLRWQQPHKTTGLGLADDVDARSFSRVRDADLCVVHCLENMCRDFR